MHTLGEFYPHRIYGYANIYDVLSEALGDFRGRSDELREQRRRLFEKLLQLYGPFDFEGELKLTLLKCDFPEVERATEGAIARALQIGKPYLASQLLPPLARFKQAAALARNWGTDYRWLRHEAINRPDRHGFPPPNASRWDLYPLLSTVTKERSARNHKVTGVL